MSSIGKDLVVFDFCETLVNFQTADTFIDYIINEERYFKLKWLELLKQFLFKFKVIAIVNRINKNFNFSKRLKLLQLRGLRSDNIDSIASKFYLEKIKCNLIPEIYEILEYHIRSNNIVIIVSGGFSPYIKLFAIDHNIKYFFATKIETKNGIFTGFFDGKDCMRNEKVSLIRSFIEENSIQFNQTIAYSDNISDLPLLLWADKGYVVSKHKTQNWSNSFGLHEIIVK